MADKVLCQYRVAPGNEETFESLLRKHWPTLRDLGLATHTPAQCFKATENGKPIYYEIFDWVDGGMGRAHENPGVMAIWEPMDQLCERRGDRPNMEFPHIEPVNA